MRFLAPLLIVVLLVACTPLPPARSTTPPAIPSPAQPSAQLMPVQFHYDQVTSYTYRARSYPLQDVSDMTYIHTVASDTANNTPAWHVRLHIALGTANLPTSPVNGYSDWWYSKQTDKCVQAFSVIDDNGKKTTTPAPCGTSITTGNQDNFIFPHIETVTVTVPAGTYRADVYGAKDAITIYIAKGVPVPVRIVLAKDVPGPGTVYELESYS